MTAKFEFTDPEVPSVHEMVHRVRIEPNFPPDRKRDCMSSLRRMGEWTKAMSRSLPPPSPKQIPFTRSNIDALFKTFVPPLLEVTRKTLDNARSDCRFVAEHYGIQSRAWVQLTPKLQRLHDRLSDKYTKLEVKRLLVFASATGLEPAAINDGVLPLFREALQRDPTVKDVERAFKRAIHAWNKGVSRVEGWPQQRLTPPRIRKVWGKPWSFFPPPLRSEAHAFLSRRRSSQRLFLKGQLVRELRESTIVTQLEQVRMVACALVRAGVPPEDLHSLRSILVPERYKAAINVLVDRASGKVTNSVKHPVMVLTKLARHAGVLTADETKNVEDAYAEVCLLHTEFLKEHVDRSEALLEQFDDPRVMDALLLLPSKTVEEVVKSGRKTRHWALKFQSALILELWLCAPLRSLNLRSLRYKDHFFTVHGYGGEVMAIRVPKREVKNGVELNHPLTPELSRMIRQYVEIYRPLITDLPSPYLFPGAIGGAKHSDTLRQQMARFVGKALGAKFHPHLIRRIVTKLILDEDPSAVETARVQLGHADDRMVRKVYGQKVQRAAQRKYLDALEARRLHAIRSAKLGRKRPKGGNGGKTSTTVSRF